MNFTCVRTTSLISFVVHFVSLFGVSSLFLRAQEETSNLCVLQWENASFLFSVKFYGTDLYNFKSSYFSIHAEYSSITTKNMLRKIRFKKNVTASHLYFQNIVMLLYYVLQSPKRKKNFEINSLFIKLYSVVCGSRLYFHAYKEIYWKMLISWRIVGLLWEKCATKHTYGNAASHLLSQVQLNTWHLWDLRWNDQTLWVLWLFPIMKHWHLSTACHLENFRISTYYDMNALPCLFWT